MINLLPENEKRDIRAARTNVTLLRYNIITFIAILILVAFCFAFYMILSNSKARALQTYDANNQKTATLANVRAAADSYRSNLTVAQTILQNGISYTDIIIAITKLLPSGVILDSLNLNATTFGQQTRFSAHATTYAVAEQLKQNFQTSKYFTNVYFETLGYDTSGQDQVSKKYPVTITFDATLNNKSGVFSQ